MTPTRIPITDAERVACAVNVTRTLRTLANDWARARDDAYRAAERYGDRDPEARQLAHDRAEWSRGKADAYGDALAMLAESLR